MSERSGTAWTSGAETDEIAAIIVATDAAAARDMAAAVDHVDGRVLARLGWDDAAAVCGYAEHAVLLVETQGADEAVLVDALARLDGVAAGRDTDVIVALGGDQIDVVSAGFRAARATLLVDPMPSERVAALVLAKRLAGAHVVAEMVREGEDARLARLNAEVARIAEVLARLSRREEPSPRPTDDAVADRRQAFGVEPHAGVAIAPNEIRQAIRARRLRDRFFAGGLFEDPAWDMMLDLFAAHLERAQVSVSSLCIASAVAPTTALRWIAKMVEAGLFERHPDPFDRRRAFMALSAKAVEGMRSYVAAVRAAELAIP